MAITHAQPGEVVDIRPLGSELANAQTRTLFKTKHLELVRMVIPAGKEIPEHKAPHEIIVQCLEGRIAFTALGKTTELEPGQLLYLNGDEPHSLKGIEDGSLLLTILLK